MTVLSSATHAQLFIRVTVKADESCVKLSPQKQLDKLTLNQQLSRRRSVQIIWYMIIHCTRWCCQPSFHHFTISKQCVCCCYIAADEFIDLPCILRPEVFATTCLPYSIFSRANSQSDDVGGDFKAENGRLMVPERFSFKFYSANLSVTPQRDGGSKTSSLSRQAK